MFTRPWDAALDDAEWQTWIADGHDFGILGVNGLPGQATDRPIDLNQPHKGRMLPGIRGPRLDVTEVHAEFTYDDHRPAEQRTDTARRPTERGTAPDAPTAAQQLRRLDRIGTWKP
ncbi:hypothetical protein [Streptomyces sp. NPDC001770]